MRIVFFTHSLLSCWNHGNAHFLRGVLHELRRLGHDAVACEPADGWSRTNLLRDHGLSALRAASAAVGDVPVLERLGTAGVELALDGADLVIVHEWTEPEIVAQIGRARAAGGRFALFFHDTHHRAASEPDAMRAYDLAAYDGVLAFGESLAAIYRDWGWGARAVVWHEAADLARFRPPAEETAREGLVWVGNWGDGERSDELSDLLLDPARAERLALDVWGVRYPPEGRMALARAHARYRGWLPNARVPEVFARHLATVHVPRRFYPDRLPGVPTIRVFEALACGIPLLSAWWPDEEGLFRPGDFLVARTGDEMRTHMRAVAHDPDLRASLAASGLETVRRRHGCAHRARELLDIAERVRGPARAA